MDFDGGLGLDLRKMISLMHLCNTHLQKYFRKYASVNTHLRELLP